MVGVGGGGVRRLGPGGDGLLGGADCGGGQLTLVQYFL